MLRLTVFCVLPVLLPATSMAGQLSLKRSAEIVQDGKVISSAPLITGGTKGDTRTHEAFIREGETVYLCFLIGRAIDGAFVRAECFD